MGGGHDDRSQRRRTGAPPPGRRLPGRRTVPMPGFATEPRAVVVSDAAGLPSGGARTRRPRAGGGARAPAAGAAFRGGKGQGFPEPHRLGERAGPFAPGGHPPFAPPSAERHRLWRRPRRSAPPPVPAPWRIVPPAFAEIRVPTAAVVLVVSPARRIRSVPVAPSRLAAVVVLNPRKFRDVGLDGGLVFAEPRIAGSFQFRDRCLERAVRLLALALAGVVAPPLESQVLAVEELGQTDADERPEKTGRGGDARRPAEEPRHQGREQGVLGRLLVERAGREFCRGIRHRRFAVGWGTLQSSGEKEISGGLNENAGCGRRASVGGRTERSGPVPVSAKPPPILSARPPPVKKNLNTVGDIVFIV